MCFFFSYFSLFACYIPSNRAHGTSFSMWIKFSLSLSRTFCLFSHRRFAAMWGNINTRPESSVYSSVGEQHTAYIAAAIAQPTQKRREKFQFFWYGFSAVCLLRVSSSESAPQSTGVFEAWLYGWKSTRRTDRGSSSRRRGMEKIYISSTMKSKSSKSKMLWATDDDERRRRRKEGKIYSEHNEYIAKIYV